MRLQFQTISRGTTVQAAVRTTIGKKLIVFHSSSHSCHIPFPPSALHVDTRTRDEPSYVAPAISPKWLGCQTVDDTAKANQRLGCKVATATPKQLEREPGVCLRTVSCPLAMTTPRVQMVPCTRTSDVGTLHFPRESVWLRGKALCSYAEGPWFESVPVQLFLQKLWFMDTVLWLGCPNNQ